MRGIASLLKTQALASRDKKQSRFIISSHTRTSSVLSYSIYYLWCASLDEEAEMNRVGTVHEFEAILWTVRDPDTALLKLILAGMCTTSHTMHSDEALSALSSLTSSLALSQARPLLLYLAFRVLH